jgi:hypothetical protein
MVQSISNQLFNKCPMANRVLLKQILCILKEAYKKTKFFRKL